MWGVVERGAGTVRFGGRGSAGFEFPRDVVGLEPVEKDVADHLAATEERRDRFEDLLAGPQTADAGRSEHLVAGEAERVGAERDNVSGDVRGRLRTVDKHSRADRVRRVGDLPNRVQRAQHVACRGDADEPHALELRVKI